MPVSLKTKVMLWGRAGGRCSFPACRRELVLDRSETDDESLIGEVAHIVAQELKGPRGESPLTLEQRDKYANLILLCAIDHKRIDDQPVTFTVESLQDMKSSHEQWVRDSLAGYNARQQKDDEIYASIIDEWATRADLTNWTAWGSWVLGADQPKMSIYTDQALEELRNWLFSRIWPGSHRRIEESLENFRQVLQDFQETFRKHSEKYGDGIETRRFYKDEGWLPEAKYQRLVATYHFHVDLVQDLFLELTRAANYVCDAVRLELDPSFRMKEGLLIVSSGPYIDFSIRQYRVEYRRSERTKNPYPGLNKFLKIRNKRDKSFGIGITPKHSDSE